MSLRYTSPSASAWPLDLIERARRYLAKMPPAVSGQHGHDQTFAVACTLVQGFGLGVADAAPLFAEYNARCSPPWSEPDLAHKLTDADRAASPTEGRGHLARSTSGPSSPRSSMSTHSSSPPIGHSSLDIGHSESDSFGTFLRACFEPADVLSIAPGAMHPEAERAIPENGGVNILTRDAWIERASSRGGIAHVFSGHHGLFIRINPVRHGAEGTDEDVTALRHVLVESDVIPKPEQERQLRASGLPIAALIDSAGNSVHAWVRIDAKNREEYHARREKVWASLPGFQIDKANKNPSRFSRCPGGLRNDGVQRLIAVNLGAASFADWEAQYEDARDIDGLANFCAENEADPPQIIEGILFRGAKMIIAGPSKSRKTWNLTDLALSVAFGQPWCGFQTRASAVIYVNLEIARFSYRKRLRIVCTARGYDPSTNARFHVWNRRGKDNEITGLATRIRKQAARIGAELIIIDPIYKTYGDREENSNTEMAQVLNELEKLAHDTSAAVLIAAHFPKGNLTGRDAIDRVAGASVFGRDPDALLIMTPHDQPDAFTVTPILRDLPPQPEFVIQWAAQHFQRIAADPKAIQGRDHKPSSGTRAPVMLTGSYRALFSDMPPMQNGKDPETSEVIAYIAKKLGDAGKDPSRATSVFHNIRQPERGIIEFCHASKTWKGVHYAPVA
ncbi:MAG: AAA family ATPase [Opitutus sp.]|nr:AAA family ATPase [Opitutus sp.]MCS6276249.1 AAA family ATPase [Opitutus sp.]MCS6301343.1 AAA family ATPase [Opitutus sp.]